MSETPTKPGPANPDPQGPDAPTPPGGPQRQDAPDVEETPGEPPRTHDAMPEGGFARDTEVVESDPNADSAEGLAGGMGVSSEHVGQVDGGQGTYGAGETHPAGAEPVPDAGTQDVGPAGVVTERSSDPATGEVHPPEVEAHDHDVERHPGHSHG